MALDPVIELEFGDGEYRFALLLPQQIELEEKCGFTDAAGNRRKRGSIAIYGDLLAGLYLDTNGKIAANPHEGRASAADCREVIRLGLIGGGRGKVNGSTVDVTPTAAEKLCQRYVDTRPIVERWVAAAAILRAAIEGYEPPKKGQPAAKPAGQSTRKRPSTPRKSSRTAE